MSFQRVGSSGKDIITNLIGGEVARIHWGNIGTGLYNTSAKEINNMIVMSTGALKKRPGTFLLERSHNKFITYPWNDNDIILREAANYNDKIEYKIYSNNIEVKDWTLLDGQAFSQANLWQIMLSEPERLIIGTKNGILVVDTTNYDITVKTIVQPLVAEIPGFTLVDFTNAILFGNLLVTFQSGYLFYSESGSPYVFNTTKSISGLSKAGYEKIAALQEGTTEIIQAVAVDNFILLATNHGIYAVFRNTIDQVVFFYANFISSEIAIDGGLLFIHGSAYFGTDKAIYSIDTREIGQTNTYTGPSGVIQNNNVRSTGFRVDSITVNAEHVFSTDPNKRIIKYSRHRLASQEIIYGLRADGIIICFSIIPKAVSGGSIDQLSVTRRTCEGRYDWIASNFMNTVVSVRKISTNDENYFVEKNIYRNNCDDNKITHYVYEFDDMDNYLFFDCGEVINGILNYEAEKDVNNPYITTKKNSGILQGDRILINGKLFYPVLRVDTNSNQFYDLITVDETVHHNVLNLNGKLIINAKAVLKYTDKYFNSMKGLSNVRGFSYNVHHNGLLHVDFLNAIDNNVTNHNLPVPSSVAGSYLITAGFNYDAYVRLLHTTTTTKVERLSCGVTSIETEKFVINVFDHGMYSEEKSYIADVSLSTEYKELDIANIAPYQNLLPQIKISSVSGDNLVILNIVFTITYSSR